ncbi:putative secreted protein (Por secretion system target) [Winogradskyella wandonensis]|uniref:Putative secreted protein (Por secretion system target) n=1 Tax=Winogradskyella wandonensis TaxID=1442586 RepID=A0A4R1KGZ6_9FLAO|nr:T9SS type A sorting domain-containing protein [Winogradskyella wandonensis]TCK64036.1 putative secreted protein (Por secretion system target) [Winogradskyella wandonensis]
MNASNRSKAISSFRKIVLLLLLVVSFSSYAQYQRVRLNFSTSETSTRQILLTFTPNNEASDGFDYGWDSQAWNYFPTDANWLIGDIRCIVQAVGSYNDSLSYPLGIYLQNTQEFTLELHSLENFDNTINVYLYDSEEETYTRLNESNHVQTIEAGEYTNRFFIKFSNNQAALSINDNEINSNSIKYYNTTKQLRLNTSKSQMAKIQIFDILGKRVYSKELKTNSSRNNISLEQLKKGIYIVKASIENQSITKKIIIQ